MSKEPALRKPVVCGQFYPASEKELRKQLASFVPASAPKSEAIACMLPHAGYVYSGRVAAETLSRVLIKETVILLGPNHTGYGKPFSIMTQGTWQTPFGEIAIDNALAQSILKSSKYLEEDSLAHLYEHSLEVELPIFQYFKPQFKIVPLVILAQHLGVLKEVGCEIAEAIEDSNAVHSVLIAASSDMTHYEPQETARQKDARAIDAILKLDEDLLAREVQNHRISMCGYAAAVIMLSAAKKLGAKKAELIKYQTSGDINQDKESVVGYAGIVVYP